MIGRIGEDQSRRVSKKSLRGVKWLSRRDGLQQGREQRKVGAQKWRAAPGWGGKGQRQKESGEWLERLRPLKSPSTPTAVRRGAVKSLRFGG